MKYVQNYILENSCYKIFVENSVKLLITLLYLRITHLIMFYFHIYANYIIQLKLFAPFIIAFNESNQDVKG